MPDIEPKNRIPGEPEFRPVSSMTEEEKTETVLKVLRGEEKPANETAAYLAQKLQDLMSAGPAIQKELAGLQKRTHELRQELARVQANVMTYRDDLVEWQRRKSE